MLCITTYRLMLQPPQQTSLLLNSAVPWLSLWKWKPVALMNVNLFHILANNQLKPLCLHPDTKANNGCRREVSADKSEDSVESLASKVKPIWLRLQ